MGKSSVYNRLKLGGCSYFKPIGYTIGWGHFPHNRPKFSTSMREFLRLIDHPYADQHKFGEGPNWRLRTIRSALGQLGINESVLRHGIKREVFLSCFATNSTELLKAGYGRPSLKGLLTVSEISDLAVQRWIAPRGERRLDYLDWRKTNIAQLINGNLSSDSNEVRGADLRLGRTRCRMTSMLAFIDALATCLRIATQRACRSMSWSTGLSKEEVSSPSASSLPRTW